MNDQSELLQQQVQQAVAEKRMLRIFGGNSKTFYGNHTSQGDVLETRIHQGIIHYEPSELVISARAGTSLQEIEQVLAERKQMLAFEPPHFGAHATLGGCIACGLSGPRRPFAGAVRDHVLGMRVLTGKGDLVKFGGEVMKNVAGYDVSRLMTGAMGTLGVLIDVSLRVVPQPEKETTLCLAQSRQQALQLLQELMQKPFPVSAAVHEGEKLYLRLSGSVQSVTTSASSIGGENIVGSEYFWQQVREQQHRFFTGNTNLWRLSLPLGRDIETEEPQLLDWAGAQRWLYSERSADEIRQQALTAGGHAVLFRATHDQERFQRLPAKLRQFHLNLKEVFDPYGILNYGRLYSYL